MEEYKKYEDMSLIEFITGVLGISLNNEEAMLVNMFAELKEKNKEVVYHFPKVDIPFSTFNNYKFREGILDICPTILC